MLNLNEALTIYLAIGAPFGAWYFLNSPRGGKFTAALKTLGVVGGWPFAFGYFLTAGDRKSFFPGGGKAPQVRESALLRARRELENELRHVEAAARSVSPSGADREIEADVRVSLLAVEKHFHLLVAYGRMTSEASPRPLALELCRLAGREGDDLQIAALCIHRRNAARLGAQCCQSVNEVAKSLMSLRRTALSAPAADAGSLVGRAGLTRAVIELFDRAACFLSLADDAAASKAVSELSAESVRLRRNEEAERHARHVGDFYEPVPRSDGSTLAPLR